MSRWSPESLQIALFPARVIATRIESGWRTRVVDKRIVETTGTVGDEKAGQPGTGPPGSAPAWESTVAALDEVLVDFTAPGTPATVIVSSRFVRYIIVPWRDNVISAPEQAEFARHCFRNIYGESTADWEIRISSGGFRRNALASAVDAKMLRTVEKILVARGFPIVSIQPNFMAACNRFRRELSGYSNGCIAVLEPGRVALGIFDKSGWHALISRRIGTSKPRELVSVLAQELKLAGPGGLPEYLFVAAIGPTTSSFFRTRTNAWLAPKRSSIPEGMP